MTKKLIGIIIFITFLLIPISSATAQTYYFQLDQSTVNVFWNEDGTSSIDYVFVFTNDISASPIEYVDVGLLNRNFDVNSIFADVNGQPVSDISTSDYQGSGNAGVAIGLGSLAIQPGETGTVHVFIGTQRDVLYPDDNDSNYVSAVFNPTYFGSAYVYGSTDMCVSFHFPPGVQPDEPRWHEAPPSFPSEPVTGVDQDGLLTYTWCNPNASASTIYSFGASFPKQYIPASAIITPSFWEKIGINPDDLIGFVFCCSFALFFIGIIGFSIRSSRRRKLKYLSPKIAVEGHGIKRGLTSVEAAVLLEQPMDKILTMILFSTIKKSAATVKSRDPLELEIADPLPEGLRTYEVAFLNAFKKTKKSARRKALQSAMVSLVKSVSKKMKGFSRRETVAYYKDIVKRAWMQVEAADTPEIKSKKYDEVMEWTMLDDDYDKRTQDVFRTGPVFVPVWWHRYDPSFPKSAPSGTSVTVTPSSSGRTASLPHLPGSDFAASIVGGVQAVSAGVVGNITSFTGGVTQRTNPIPVRSSGYRGGGGGGGGCACACACAGCACACAGGGR
jgi:hypothetical protein